MDWAAKLFGLNEVFHGQSGVGGGIILVSAEALATPMLLTPGIYPGLCVGSLSYRSRGC